MLGYSATDDFKIDDSKIKTVKLEPRSAAAEAPGLCRVWAEVERPNSLVRTFDNKC
jgi:hypothetical protein